MWDSAPAARAAHRRIAAIDINSSILQSTLARTPALARLHTATAASSHPSCGLRAESVFCDHRLQHFPIETQVRHQTLQTRVLVYQQSQPLGFPYIHAVVLRLPRIDLSPGRRHPSRAADSWSSQRSTSGSNPVARQLCYTLRDDISPREP